jgi:hypothetical protein
LQDNSTDSGTGDSAKAVPLRSKSKERKEEREKKKAITTVIGYSNNGEQSQERIRSRLSENGLLARQKLGNRKKGNPSPGYRKWE